MAFMSPERLVPSKFGVGDSISTLEADIYAFGLVIFHVCEQDSGIVGSFFTLFRSSQAKPRSAMFNKRSWDSLWLKGCDRPNQETPQPSGFPIHCGVSSNAAGMAT